ncbi:MAG TPA: hypothetical protein DIT18_08585, partial [Pseudomonas sp.]|nr:hypothetical protein [Pseudomonas sp.]
MKTLPACGLVLCALYSHMSWSDLLNEPAPKDAVLAPLLSAHDSTSQRFFSVGRMRGTIGIGWSCTATLVAGSDEPDPHKPALILTAGHCAAGTTGDNEVVMNRPMSEGWLFTPSYFHDNKDQHVSIPITTILYSTMKSTDLGVLQLGETYGQVLARGFKPVRLKALEGTRPDIDIAHIPQGLFPDHYLRYSECSSRPPAAIVETVRKAMPRPDVPWFLDLVPNECIGLYGGSSGAPIFARGEWNVIGVHSTGLREPGCGAGKPCEIEAGQPVSRLDTSYFASIARFVDAFKADGSFDPSHLDPGTGILVSRQGAGDSQDGPGSPVRWGMLIDESYESIRYKFGF